ncbi:3'-5' exonuclease [Draconibacterium sp. IB214405]|uniref:3'-5' exonuclease n=1 Tax=Draconibacterium sp. IB214405 TaxID=3097352 RepID=UPI002A0D69B4|nr:3'-5' exonuclease [Draconibacterium sp. IB214405]MDX8338772.1 3'-5' exonuclease [Draconibacterium sp. IB214405]
MDICFIDFETTGIDVFKDNPIEIGCTLTNQKGDILQEFHSYIKPKSKRKTSASAKNIHGINTNSLMNAPTQKEVLIKFFKEMGTNYRFAGWNINFDVTFFRRMCHLNNMMGLYNKIYHRHIDIQSIVFYLKESNRIPNNLNSLNDLASFYKLDRDSNHSALQDSRLANIVYKKIISFK